MAWILAGCARSGFPLPESPYLKCTACHSARCPLKGVTGGCSALAARCKVQKQDQPAHSAALRCAAQAGRQAQVCGGAMGPLPGASRSTGSLSGSSLRCGRGGVGCFQMSGSCSRGWYTDISDPSSLVLLLMQVKSLVMIVDSFSQRVLSLCHNLVP